MWYKVKDKAVAENGASQLKGNFWERLIDEGRGPATSKRVGGRKKEAERDDCMKRPLFLSAKAYPDAERNHEATFY